MATKSKKDIVNSVPEAPKSRRKFAIAAEDTHTIVIGDDEAQVDFDCIDGKTAYVQYYIEDECKNLQLWIDGGVIDKKSIREFIDFLTVVETALE